jgi:hypothetical protein
MKTKPILCPQRLRHVPRQFSWIDQRLVRDGRIQGRSPEALALYLLLCTVADAQGISYYSDASTGRILSLASGTLRAARNELVAAGLIAYRAPFYQVLSLDAEPGTGSAPSPSTAAKAVRSAAPALEVPEPRDSGDARSIAEILREMLAQGETNSSPKQQ